MPIEALPQATVRAIGSTSVISDPCSVVKELLDNALDASASSVSVEISQNTVDLIQVKDNGHGISAEDHPCVCKHTFTSKISSIDDLKLVGGTSLGFRGEALASVAEMSGGVNIITRVASDIVASNLEYGRDGGLSRSQKTSHPIGTTVRIQNFLKYIPVRRQAALKGATKCLAKIKSLIQAYAMAQPSKRFTLKVLKAKNENNNWCFASGSDSALADAAVKVVGRDVASCCTTIQSTSTVNINDASLDQTNYEVTAFLPKVDADFTKVNKKGQFLSIDGRPLSTSRGVGHDMARLFKSYIRAVDSKIEAPKSVSDPFLCLQLKCPLGSYDVNIEPGKDDVLFEDRELVFSLIESLFTNHYGALPDAVTKSPAKKKTSTNAHSNNANFDLLLARRPTQSSQMSPKENSSSEDVPILTNNGAQRLSDPPAVPSPERTPSKGGPGRGLHNNPVCGGESVRQINSWSISRISPSFQAPSHGVPQFSTLQTSPAAPPQGSRQSNTPQRPTSASRPQISELPSPVLLELTPVSPLSRRPNHQTPHESSLQSTSSNSTSRRAARERDKERYGNGALDTWFQRTTQPLLAPKPPEALVVSDEAVPSLSQLAEQRFNPPQGVSTVTLSPENSNQPLSARPLRVQTPDLSPQQIDDITLPNDEHQTRAMNSGRGFPVLENWAASIHEGFTPESSFELEKALDFERRKREANQRHRTRSGQLTVRTTASASNSPHRNRYIAAKAALTVGSVGAGPLHAPTFPDGDPRAYLMSLQTDQLSIARPEDAGMARRSRTSRLPLERIPEGLDLHNICLAMKAGPPEIRKLFNVTAHRDSYTRCGDDPEPSLLSDVTAFVPSWNERLSMIVSKCYRNRDTSQPPDLRIDISTAIADIEKRCRATESQSA